MSRFNPTEKAERHLNAILNDTEVSDEVVILDETLKEIAEENEKSKKTKQLESDIQAYLHGKDLDIESARKEKQLLTTRGNRERVRVLFLTKDESVLREGSSSFTRVTDLSHTFLEVHVILLNLKGREKMLDTVRLTDSVWVYPTQSSSWWRMILDASRIAQKQMVFAGGFRVDVIVAEDVFEAGLVAHYIAKRHKRPFQLHIYEDFFDEDYVDRLDHPTFYTWAYHYLINRVSSIRTRTEVQLTAVKTLRDAPIEDIEVLPTYYDLKRWQSMKPTLDLHLKYPQFKFIILHITDMHRSSCTHEVLLGVSPLLRRYPSIGLLVVGSGPLCSLHEKQVIALGLQKQIEFEPMPDETLPYIASANLVIHLSEDSSQNDVILQAAVVKTPLIASTKGIGGKLCVDHESARLCAPTDISCISESINMYLNDNHARREYVLRAHEAVFEQVAQDYNSYLDTYSASIERSLILGGTNEEKGEL